MVCSDQLLLDDIAEKGVKITHTPTQSYSMAHWAGAFDESAFNQCPKTIHLDKTCRGNPVGGWDGTLQKPLHGVPS